MKFLRSVCFEQLHNNGVIKHSDDSVSSVSRHSFRHTQEFYVFLVVLPSTYRNRSRWTRRHYQRFLSYLPLSPHFPKVFWKLFCDQRLVLFLRKFSRVHVSCFIICFFFPSLPASRTNIENVIFFFCKSLTLTNNSLNQFSPSHLVHLPLVQSGAQFRITYQPEADVKCGGWQCQFLLLLLSDKSVK